MLLAGGLVFQAGGASCAAFSAEIINGLGTSIASELISNVIYDLFGLTSFSFF
jgi:hypothetical protein